MTRERLKLTTAADNNKRVREIEARLRIKQPGQDVSFFGSGCTLLDCSLGGGWAERRVINIIGDKSVGKTMIATEAGANFVQKYKQDGKIKYKECEAAWDHRYASSLGVPLDRFEFGQRLNTVEDMFDDISDSMKAKVPTLEIIDSLDALSDKAEMDREFGDATYGTGKARDLSKLFRLLVRDMERTNLTLMAISQIRSRIGISFGRQTARTGGRALDFYASQVVYLKHTGTVYRTVDNVKRPVAYEVSSKVDKNKVGPPLREVDFVLEFGYGINDLETCMTWLKQVKHLDDVGCNETTWKKRMRQINNLKTEEDYKKELRIIQGAVRKRWTEIETGFLPKRRKYNND